MPGGEAVLPIVEIPKLVDCLTRRALIVLNDGQVYCRMMKVEQMLGTHEIDVLPDCVEYGLIFGLAERN